MPSLIASKRDTLQTSKQVFLSIKEVEHTIAYLHNLTREKSDSIAGGKSILALTITPEKVELLLDYTGDKLQQVIGRLKSRSASALLYHRKEEKHIWSKGFWQAQLLDSISKQAILNYFTK